MRRNALLLSITVLALVLVLAACNGGTSTPAPTTDPNAAVVTPGDASTTEADGGERATLPPVWTQAPREFETGQAPLPVPGTLEAPQQDEEIGLVFDKVLFERTGGLAGTPLTIEILQNGNVTRDGVASTIGAGQITQIDNLIDQMNFFYIEGVFTSAGSNADIYHYRITVDRNGASRTVDAEDNLLPQPLRELISTLMDIGA